MNIQKQIKVKNLVIKLVVYKIALIKHKAGLGCLRDKSKYTDLILSKYPECEIKTCDFKCQKCKSEYFDKLAICLLEKYDKEFLDLD